MGHRDPLEKIDPEIFYSFDKTVFTEAKSTSKDSEGPLGALELD